MMDSHSDSDEEQYFDVPKDIDYVSNCDSDNSNDDPNNISVSDPVSTDPSYDFWTQTPESVHDRKSRFFEQMGLSLKENPIAKEEPSRTISFDETKNDIDCKKSDIGGLVRDSSSDYSLFSNRSSMSCSSTEDDDLSTDYDFEDNLVNKIGDMNINSEIDSGKHGIISKLREVGTNKLIKMEKLHKNGKNNVNNWLKQLRKRVHTIDSKEETSSKNGACLRRTRVRSHKKKFKELSSLYEGQDFRAHEGLILAMKFSPSGKFLASGGEDGVVRVWEVVEEERERNLDMECFDPSCLYFSVNHDLKLVPVEFGKDENSKEKSSQKLKNPGCVIFPPKVFRIAEEPFCEFRGHCGEVLSLSWSSNECILSSSTDKTVRLWKLGNDECLRVFCHTNYVTCIEFNPVNENYFISGSVDGKIRVWEVSGCRVVDWIDIREIVTAVCYYPDGKRGIVGSMDGSCRFYDITDNQLQLDTQIFVPAKKKLPCKRITGFQFSSSDSSKILVSSADSQVRILSGSDVIFKLKGPWMSGSQVTASFTEDGKHIVSGTEDSNINVWDYNITSSPSKANSIGSRESFLSHNSSISVPWCGFKSKSTSSLSNPRNDLLSSILRNLPCDNNPSIMESWPKGAATWPEERLNDAYITRLMGRSEMQALKDARNSICSSHMWGLVIVTAGRDGRIRTYHNYGLPIHA